MCLCNTQVQSPLVESSVRPNLLCIPPTETAQGWGNAQTVFFRETKIIIPLLSISSITLYLKYISIHLYDAATTTPHHTGKPPIFVFGRSGAFKTKFHCNRNSLRRYESWFSSSTLSCPCRIASLTEKRCFLKHAVFTGFTRTRARSDVRIFWHK